MHIQPPLLLCACAVIHLSSARASAQLVFPGEPALWQWQASLDNGQTWSGGAVNVSTPSSSVRIRGLATFPTTFDRAYFGGVQFDPYVEGISNVGLGDTISSITLGQMQPRFQFLQARRFGNRIRIDDEVDFLPPGVGTSWALSGQAPNNGTSPEPVFDNPVSVFEYTLSLDGTLGDRLVTAAWSTDTAFGYSPYITTYVRTFEHRGQQWRHPTTEETITIRVIPAPASAALFLLALPLAARRRRA
jgi:hypothetical protein